MSSDSMNADFSTDDAREFLLEIREATQGSSQSDIYEFSGLLCQLIDLLDAPDGVSEADNRLSDLVNNSLNELRSVVAADQSTSDLMESLRQEAIDCWGGMLVPDEDSCVVADLHSDDQWEAVDDADDSDLSSPSAEEVSSLLLQLGQHADAMNEAANATAVEVETAEAESTEFATTPTGVSTTSTPTPPATGGSCAASIQALDPELREAFMDDATSCVASMEAALLRLDTNSNDAEALNQICRELHTLKGASASVGLSELADHLHGLEDSLRADHTAGRAPGVDSLLENVDWIRDQLSGDSTSSTGPVSPAPVASAPVAPAPVAPAPVAPRPESPAKESAAAIRTAPASPMPAISEGPADDETVRVKSSQLNRLMDMLAELVMLRNRRETELNELQEVYHELIGSVSTMRLLSYEENREATTCSSLQLSEVANDVLEIAQHVRDCARPVAEGNTAVSQFIRQFRQELVELRRTPISGLFRRLQRVVRDAAQAESKQVRLQLIGEDAGIERSLQQRLYEPLLHIVRNSVCHGIETPDERSKHGKDAVGTITLEAKSGPDLFMIEIRDDGGGLDYDAIRRRGVEKGLLTADQSASRQELSQLIFHPGFSTRETASQVAGRGVGMDVVATTLQRMRGWLEVDSEPQQGTRIRLSFPLPSVIQHAMVFRSAGQLFALPMQSVQSASAAEHASSGVVFSDLLGNTCHETPESYQRIVLVGDTSSSGSDQGKSRVTLLVDEVVGPEEVVVRPLPTMLKQHPFCSGATLSGMGQIVLFLDAHRVVQAQTRYLLAAPGSAIQLSADNGSDPSVQPRVLVVDDSISARKRVVRSLQRYPVDVFEASDGKQALEILQKERFAAVFSDMEMPHINGLELLTEVGSQDRYEPPPIVIISSRSEDEFTVPAKELGANDYLIKPLSDEALDQTLAGIPLLRHLKAERTTTLQTSGELQ